MKNGTGVRVGTGVFVGMGVIVGVGCSVSIRETTVSTVSVDDTCCPQEASMIVSPTITMIAFIFVLPEM
jgi:tetrahydrodipicolinate N-succinyltransferase